MLCKNCEHPIQHYSVYGNQGYWYHPDQADYDNHGTRCIVGGDDEGDEAEPLISEIYETNTRNNDR